jgi:hypothetical protein
MASTACLCAGLCVGKVQEPPAESLRCVGESGGPGLALALPAASFCCRMVSCMHVDEYVVASAQHSVAHTHLGLSRGASARLDFWLLQCFLNACHQMLQHRLSWLKSRYQRHQHAAIAYHAVNCCGSGQHQALQCEPTAATWFLDSGSGDAAFVTAGSLLQGDLAGL